MQRVSWKVHRLIMMPWSKCDQMWFVFQHSLPAIVAFSRAIVAGAYVGSPLQRIDSRGIEALILILEKVLNCKLWPHHRSDTASQPSVFFSYWEQKKQSVGAKSEEYGGWSTSSKPHSRTAAIATTDLCAGALYWWNRTPFVSFPGRFEMSLVLLFTVLNDLSSVGLSGRKQCS